MEELSVSSSTAGGSSETFSANDFIELMKDCNEMSEQAADMVEVTPKEEDLSTEEEPYRSRCNTWPKRDFDSFQETELDTESGNNSSSSSPSTASVGHKPLVQTNTLPLVCEEDSVCNPMEDDQTCSPSNNVVVRSKSSSRRNPWGNMSYADLITQAIQSAPDQRLTLAQIYEWLIKNVLYFHEKGDNNSSIGWKNSIRHNLSLHNRFVRVQNEGAGKSSWWTLNPEMSPKLPQKHGNRRRANTLDSSSGTCSKLEQKQRKLRCKYNEKRGNRDHLSKPLRRVNSNTSLLSESVTDLASLNVPPEHMRYRTYSNASSCGRLSPPNLPFRSRTLSNASSSCDHSSPPNECTFDNNNKALSPWSQYPRPGASPNFQDSPLHTNDNHSEEDLECLELLNLNLDARSSQLLLEALYNEKMEGNNNDQQNPRNSELYCMPDQGSAIPSQDEFSLKEEPGLSDVNSIDQFEDQRPQIKNKIKILEPREAIGSTSMSAPNFLEQQKQQQQQQQVPLQVQQQIQLQQHFVCDEDFNVSHHQPQPFPLQSSFVPMENETRQLRQLLCIREHQWRHQKLQQQQNMMLSGGGVVGSNNSIPQTTFPHHGFVNYAVSNFKLPKHGAAGFLENNTDPLTTVSENFSGENFDIDYEDVQQQQQQLQQQPNQNQQPNHNVQRQFDEPEGGNSLAEFGLEQSGMNVVDPISVGGFSSCNDNLLNRNTSSVFSLGTTC